MEPVPDACEKYIDDVEAFLGDVAEAGVPEWNLGERGVETVDAYPCMVLPYAPIESLVKINLLTFSIEGGEK